MAHAPLTEETIHFAFNETNPPFIRILSIGTADINEPRKGGNLMRNVPLHVTQLQFPEYNPYRNARWFSGGITLLVGIVIAALLAVGDVQPLFATDFRGGDTITVGADEVIDDDLFISGDTVTINGTVRGNLFASGTVVTVNGPVEGSLFLAGRTLALNSTVEGSAYVGGYAFTLGENAMIGRNLNFGGFSLTARPDSGIGRSLYAGGYQILLNGAVDDDVNIGSAALELTGYVGGDVQGSVGSPEETAPSMYMPSFEGAIAPVAPGLRVSDGAEVVGDLSVTVQAPTAEATPAPIYSLANQQLRWAIGEVVALLMIGLLFLYIRPSLLENAGIAVQSQPLKSLGVGFLVLLVAIAAVPIVIGVLITLGFFGGIFTLGQLVGDILGLGVVSLLFAIGVFLFTAGMLTKIVVAYGGGRLLVRNGTTGEAIRGPAAFLAIFIGVIIYMALRLIPVFGWLLALVVTLMGLGALYLALRHRHTPRTAEAVVPYAPREIQPVA